MTKAKTGIRRRDLIDESELKLQATEVLSAICAVPVDSPLNVLNSAPWQSLRDLLAGLSESRATQGFTPSETVLFVLSLKSPLFGLIRDQTGNNPDQLYSFQRIVDFMRNGVRHASGRSQALVPQCCHLGQFLKSQVDQDKDAANGDSIQQNRLNARTKIFGSPIPQESRDG